MKTGIYIEQGAKKSIAWSQQWPGWCRVRKNEAEALEALRECVTRYRRIAARAGLLFEPGELVVVERLPGDGLTDWGAPSVLAPADTAPVDLEEARSAAVLLRAAWDTLADVVTTAPSALRKGPRGGGRDRDEVWRHAVEAERTYARKIGVRLPPFDVHDASAVAALHQEIIAVVSRPSSGGPLAPGGWNARYALRRMAWHVVDHAWEIEDRS